MIASSVSQPLASRARPFSRPANPLPPFAPAVAEAAVEGSTSSLAERMPL